jgi:hypothetical protein
VVALKQQLVITVLIRGDEDLAIGTRGTGYVDQVFSEAGLINGLDGEKVSSFWQRLRVLHRALEREFGDRVIVQILNPWTLRGWWFAIRHHVREFPSLVVEGQSYPSDISVTEIIKIVKKAL